MVCVTEKPNFLDASCCKVEVIKGADGDFFAGFLSKFSTEKLASLHVSRNSWASFFVGKFFGRWSRPLRRINIGLGFHLRFHGFRAARRKCQLSWGWGWRRQRRLRGEMRFRLFFCCHLWFLFLVGSRFSWFVWGGFRPWEVLGIGSGIVLLFFGRLVRQWSNSSLHRNLRFRLTTPAHLTLPTPHFPNSNHP